VEDDRVKAEVSLEGGEDVGAGSEDKRAVYEGTGHVDLDEEYSVLIKPEDVMGFHK